MIDLFIKLILTPYYQIPVHTDRQLLWRLQVTLDLCRWADLRVEEYHQLYVLWGGLEDPGPVLPTLQLRLLKPVSENANRYFTSPCNVLYLVSQVQLSLTFQKHFLALTHQYIESDLSWSSWHLTVLSHQQQQRWWCKIRCYFLKDSCKIPLWHLSILLSIRLGSSLLMYRTYCSLTYQTINISCLQHWFDLIKNRERYYFHPRLYSVSVLANIVSIQIPYWHIMTCSHLLLLVGYSIIPPTNQWLWVLGIVKHFLAKYYISRWRRFLLLVTLCCQFCWEVTLEDLILHIVGRGHESPSPRHTVKGKKKLSKHTEVQWRICISKLKHHWFR